MAFSCQVQLRTLVTLMKDGACYGIARNSRSHLFPLLPLLPSPPIFFSPFVACAFSLLARVRRAPYLRSLTADEYNGEKRKLMYTTNAWHFISTHLIVSHSVSSRVIIFFQYITFLVIRVAVMHFFKVTLKN